MCVLCVCVCVCGGGCLLPRWVSLCEPKHAEKVSVAMQSKIDTYHSTTEVSLTKFSQIL